MISRTNLYSNFHHGQSENKTVAFKNRGMWIINGWSIMKMRTNAPVFHVAYLWKKLLPNKDGYSNWKNAKGAEGGFKSHENDEHNQAMKLWDDRNNGDKSSSTIIDKIANKPQAVVVSSLPYDQRSCKKQTALTWAWGIHRLRCFWWIIFELNELPCV